MYSDGEREHIRRRLLEEAECCLAQYGVRKTTVDELVRRVRIPKGTFYLFYASKELLFFEVLRSLHDRIQAELSGRLGALGLNPGANAVAELLFDLFKRVEETALFGLITGGDLEYLVRKLPEEIVEAHAAEDDLNVERLVARLPGCEAADIPAVSAALRAAFFTALHRREIGREVFDDALKLMLRGIVVQMYKGDSR
jgi:AcrR family transcriptional regulator